MPRFGSTQTLFDYASYPVLPPDWFHCDYVVMVGSPTRTEIRCGEPTEGAICERHQRFLTRLAERTDQPLEIR